MKITLRILIIIAITALVAGGVYLLVENTSIASNLDADHGDKRADFAEGERVEGERGERSEGDHDHGENASFTRGLAQMSASLVKIGVITAGVLGIQFAFRRLNQWKKTQVPT